MVKQDIYVNEEDEVQKKKNQRGSTFNGLTANEWTINSKSVWSDIKAPKKTDFYDNGENFKLINKKNGLKKDFLESKWKVGFLKKKLKLKFNYNKVLNFLRMKSR